MQTISPAIRVAGANSYYKDEYQIDENQSIINPAKRKSGNSLIASSGRWRGKLAEEFGLEGTVKADEFRKLTEGQHPKTGEQIVRQVKSRPKKNKNGEILKDKYDKPIMTTPRRAGYDLTLSAPKSVSIVAVVGRDERIAVVHRRAVERTFDEIEKFVEARMGNVKPTERTGKAVWAIFSHDLARPDGKENYAAPDLHDHGFLFNSTKTQDGKYRAIQPYELFCSQQFATAIYRNELANGLKKIGYEIHINKKTNAPEIVGISRDYIEASSPRQNEVKAKAKELGLHSTKKVARLSRRKKNFDRVEMHKRHLEFDKKFGFQAQQTVAKAKANSIKMQSQILTEAEEKNEIRQNAKNAVLYAICEAKKKPQLHNWRTIVTTALNEKMGETTFDEVKNEIENQKKNGAFKDFDLEKKISRKVRRQNIFKNGHEEVLNKNLELKSSALSIEKKSELESSLTNYQFIEKIKEVKNERNTGRKNTTQHRETSAESTIITPIRNESIERELKLGKPDDNRSSIIENSGQPTNRKRARFESEKSTNTRSNTEQFSRTKSKSASHQSGESNSANWQQSITDESEYADSQRRSSENSSKNRYNVGVQKKSDSKTSDVTFKTFDGNQISGAREEKEATGRRKNDEGSHTATRTSNKNVATEKEPRKTRLEKLREEGIRELSDNGGNIQNILPNLPRCSGQNVGTEENEVERYSQRTGVNTQRADRSRKGEAIEENQNSGNMGDAFENFALNNITRSADPDNLDDNFNNDYFQSTNISIAGNFYDTSLIDANINPNTIVPLQRVSAGRAILPIPDIVQPVSIDSSINSFQSHSVDSHQQFQPASISSDDFGGNNFNPPDAVYEVDSIKVPEITSLKPLDKTEREYIQQEATVSLQEAEKAENLEKDIEQEGFDEQFILSI